MIVNLERVEFGHPHRPPSHKAEGGIFVFNDIFWKMRRGTDALLGLRTGKFRINEQKLARITTRLSVATRTANRHFMSC